MIKHMSIKASSCLDMINALNSRISELDPNYVQSSETINANDCLDDEAIESSEIPAQEYIQAADGDITEDYIDDMMQYVADEVTANLNSTCSWRVEDSNIVFIIAGLNDESIEEYTCPFEDLTGETDADVNYILESIGI